MFPPSPPPLPLTLIIADDCWMLANRTEDGHQIANPSKFPAGFKDVADFIHSLGLKSGLYTAKGPRTCAGFAASCNHEALDAAQWASWGIDYVKDDSCSSCGNFTDNELYHAMWLGIQNSGREMVLTVEGHPDNSLGAAGGIGNAKRVGHDISPRWNSMTSLVDIGSGLWMFAHNSSTTTYGGWWNDLDVRSLPPPYPPLPLFKKKTYVQRVYSLLPTGHRFPPPPSHYACR